MWFFISMKQGQAAADRFRPHLGTERGEVAVADLLVIKQASGGAFATFFSFDQQTRCALTKASAGFKNTTALVFRALEIAPG